jgi:NTP pyrophosphatase (non-canonical NTP hydrolase)
VDFKAFQESAEKTDMHPSSDPKELMIPMLGLLGEAGSLATVYKKYLRDGIPWDSNRDFIQQELGDLLWYVATIATHCNLDLDEIARLNLDRIESRYGDNDQRGDDERITVSLDDGFPGTERFPLKMKFHFQEDDREDGEKIVKTTLVNAEPNHFPNGATERENRKKLGFTLGSPLTNNSWMDDGYRFHDAFHIAFLGTLGWSPVFRNLLGLKRKSQSKVDECEDGARAIDIEEGLSAFLSNRAPDYNYFREPKNVDNETLDIVISLVNGLEVSKLPTWLWKNAISSGFTAMEKLKENGGGYLLVNLDQHSVVYSKEVESGIF